MQLSRVTIMTRKTNSNAATATQTPVATIGHNSFDVKAEHDFIKAMGKDFDRVSYRAASAAREYVKYSLNTRNCDLIRHFYENLPALYQPKLVTWLRTVSPIVKRVKTDKVTKAKSISFGLDKDRIAEMHKANNGLGGLYVYDETAFAVPFFEYKKPKQETVLELTKLVNQLMNKADNVMQKLPGFEVEVNLQDKVKRLAEKIAETLGCASDVLDIGGSYSYDAASLPGQRIAASKTATSTTVDNIHNLEA